MDRDGADAVVQIFTQLTHLNRFICLAIGRCDQTAVGLVGGLPAHWTHFLVLQRGLKAWMRSAITSLPVPLSPVISTATSLGAMRSTVRTTSRITTLWNTGEAVPLMVSSARRSMLVSSVCWCFSRALVTSANSFSDWKGLERKL